ncbi:MAG: sulfite exporter TauE/SafE family protein, partial [Pontimonas sp.]
MQENTPPPWLPLVIIGLIGGFFAGTFGVGGGLVMVPLLLWWTTFDQRRANATSLLAITPASLIGAISFSIGGVFEWFPAIFVALGSVLGAQLGARSLS